MRSAKMAAAPGSCPAQQDCIADPAPASHRRRQCNERIERAAAGDKQGCKLPENAIWCEVHLKNLPVYFMATYDMDTRDDWVSYNVCQAGYWEENDMSEFGAPGHMLDIGGNIGYHTFAFAQAGWNVTTFEPMAPNQALIRATMCRNPKLASKIHLNQFGLGTVSQKCKMMSPIHNVGDGHVKCGEVAPPEGFQEVGQFSIRRLDEVLHEQKIDKVDLVKIDVEGYESQVFAGAPNFLTDYHPRVIKSEAWDNMINSTGAEYLNMFEQAGYKFFSDSKCQLPMDAKTEVRGRGLDVIMCK